MTPSSPSPLIDYAVDFNTDNLAGQAYVGALHAANELPGNTKFVPCDVTHWEDQIRLFEQAAEFGSSGKIYYVIANAGMTRSDDVFTFNGPDKAPQKPDLSILDINMYGVLYSTKLALHYFMSQNGVTPSPAQEDTCLILISSGAGFLDVPRSPQYCNTKSRVNVIARWYVRTSILPKETFDHVQSSGVELSLQRWKTLGNAPYGF
ncbi:hypothetical protein SBRCBS47491_009082 [Sporothrix bragantina]|uniref:Uncharacterized protein n=1 Tax=Sporothrix bragantina TaxID=671064 RepID=A0ABP0CUW5_9PEZI